LIVIAKIQSGMREPGFDPELPIAERRATG